MKQKLDKVRTLAIKLYEAAQKEAGKSPDLWGNGRRWRDLSQATMNLWDEVAICAYEELEPWPRDRGGFKQPKGTRNPK